MALFSCVDTSLTQYAAFLCCICFGGLCRFGSASNVFAACGRCCAFALVGHRNLLKVEHFSELTENQILRGGPMSMICVIITSFDMTT